MDNKKFLQFSKELEFELKNNILPYWFNKMIDKENGGFYGRITGEEVLVPESPKGSVLNARILWTFSSAYLHFPEEKKYKEVAEYAYNYFICHFFDKEKGGIFWMLDYKGEPMDPKKQIYAQAFAIYSLVEYFKVSSNNESLELAKNLFHLIERYSFDIEKNGYFEAFNRNWEILEDLRLSDKDANEKKTMNTHLHVLEAYTSLYKVWKNDELRKQLKNLIEVFINKIIDSNTKHFCLFFDENWKVKSHEVSFGHDIEGSWLLWEAVEVLEGNEDLKLKVKNIILAMAEITQKEGLDKDGGLFYESDNKIIIDSDKHWWPQAEAVVGFMNAFQLTQDEGFFNTSVKSWEFIKDKIIDKKNGEWIWRVSKDGKLFPEEDKAGFWKCPYHNGRACLEIQDRIKLLQQ